MIFDFTEQADAWFDKEQNESVRKAVVDWIDALAYASPDPDDWVGIPIEDGVTRTGFVPATEVAVTYYVWHDGGIIFIDLIEPIPRVSFGDGS